MHCADRVQIVHIKHKYSSDLISLPGQVSTKSSQGMDTPADVEPPYYLWVIS